MANVVVVGSQWGDEGKGKIVDWLSERADIVVRFQGGHNAGHTLVIDGQTYKLSLLPSGIVRGKLSVIGNGVVMDPWALDAEITAISKLGVSITRDNLRIAENTTLILPLHQELDAMREEAAGAGKIGTTKRGIGPAYEDKVGRRAIHAADLVNLKTLPAKIDRALVHHNALRRGMGQPEVDRDALLEQLIAIAPKVAPYIDTVWQLLDRNKREGKRILFEGAQGTLLDIDHGTYPFVTSSNTVAGAGSDRLRARAAAPSIMCWASPRPTRRALAAGLSRRSFSTASARCCGERGHEFGTVTGRARRCGWFDACLLRQTSKVSGMNGIALTKLDVLDGFDELKICVGYRVNGRELDHLPAAHDEQAKVQPIYEVHKGWHESTQGARRWADLPAHAIKYVKRLEELIEAPVALLSTSPEREDTILVHDPFQD